jgi:anti-anti-sigma factor
MENDEVGVPPMEVVIRSSNGAVAVQVHGEVDAATVGLLRCALEVVEEARELVVDLSAAPFVDVAGVRALGTCAKRRQRFGRDLLVVGPPRSAERILQMAPFCRSLRWEPREVRPSASVTG